MDRRSKYWDTVARAILKHGSAHRRPQEAYTYLQKLIITLNFREPLKFGKCHPHMGLMYDWNPIDLDTLKVEEQMEDLQFEFVESKEQFKKCIESLQQSKVWAIDLKGHSTHTYAGIICTLQITTVKNECFIICCFALRQEIITQLRPIMESGDYVLILHDANNDLRQMQRDFGIFAWPILDTQVIYRLVKKALNKENSYQNISYENLLKDVLHIRFDKDPADTLADFRQRPLPKALQNYAAKDTVYLFKALRQLKCEFDSGLSGIGWINLLKEANRASAKAIYDGKTYPTKFDQKPKFLNTCETNVYYALHDWRQDRARVQDENPTFIVPNSVLHRLCKLSKPISVENVQRCFDVKESNMVLEPDWKKIVKIIDASTYAPLSLDYALTLCYKCRQYSHVAALCDGIKVTKCVAEREFYDEHPEAERREKARRAKKQADKRKEKGLYWDVMKLPIVKQ